MKQYCKTFSKWDNSDYDVVVKISRPGNVIGAVPISSVKGVYQGFDWDTGKIIITTEDILTNIHSKTEDSVLSATLTNNK